MITFLRSSSAQVFSRSACQARNNRILRYTSYALAAVYVPFQGYQKFTNGINIPLTYQSTWPVIYSTLTENWVHNTLGAFTRTTVYQNYFAASSVVSIAATVVTGSAPPSGNFNTSSVATDLTYNSTGPNGTYAAALSNLMDFDTRLDEGLALLAAQSIPAFVPFNLNPGAKPITDSHVIKYYPQAAGVIRSFESIGADGWIGCAARGIVVDSHAAIAEGLAVASIKDPPLASGPGVDAATARLLCAKSTWKLRGKIALFPGASNPATETTGYNNPHLNVYLHTFNTGVAPVSIYTSNPPVPYATYISGQQITFTPDDVYAAGGVRCGELGFRSAVI